MTEKTLKNIMAKMETIHARMNAVMGAATPDASAQLLQAAKREMDVLTADLHILKAELTALCKREGLRPPAALDMEESAKFWERVGRCLPRGKGNMSDIF